MTQPPQGPPPGAGYPPPGGGQAPDQGGFQPPPEGAYPPPEGAYPPFDGNYPPPDGNYPPPDGGFGPPAGEYPVEPGYPSARPMAQEPTPPRPPQRTSPVLAPVLAFIALLIVGGASVGIVSYLGSTIDSATTDASATPGPVAAAVVDATATPEMTSEADETDVPVVITTEPPDQVAIVEPEDTAEPITVRPPSNERADIPGSLLFTRLGGDIWAASGTTIRSLTNSSSTKADSSPTWSPDGRHIYFIRSTKQEVKDGKAREKGKYTLYPTDLMRMKADASDKKRIYNSLIRDSRGQWFSHVLQPSVSSAANNVAVVSDGNQGDANEVVLHVINSASGRMRKTDTPSEPHFQVSGFGHNDPAFSPDGKQIAFTYNDDSGAEGRPRVAIFSCQSKSNCSIGKTKYLKYGYANPSWSPKGNLLAVETTDDSGRDIAIITAKGGHERVRLTTDGDSFSPEFSPNGDQIAYLKRDGLGIDVRIMTLEIDDRGKISLVDDRPVTSDGEVDGESGLSWYVPKSQLTRSVDLAEADAEASEGPVDDILEGAPPPPPGS